LLLRGEQGATAEHLADLLWRDVHDTKQGLNRLYQVVNCLRKTLSPPGHANRESPFLLHHNQRYFLAVPPNTWIDLPVFQESCYRASSLESVGQLEQALLCFQSAERLYMGDFLADLPEKYTGNEEEDWCWSRRYWLREMYLKMLCSMAGIYRKQGDTAKALEYCDRALMQDSCSERAHAEKMTALCEAQRYDAIERQYRLYCSAMSKFAHSEPSAEMMRLFQSLRETCGEIRNKNPHKPKKNQRYVS
jgi:DNA-binding SARP family transcriptional activator